MEGRKRRFGDRRDGRYLRSLDPYNSMAPYIMKVKSESSNFFSDSIEIKGIESYLRNKRRQGYPGIGILHLVVASYVRTISQYPGLNRFISGQRIFARKNIEFIMTVKKEMKTTKSGIIIIEVRVFITPALVHPALLSNAVPFAALAEKFFLGLGE